jgi:hypothetical protein
MTPLLFLQYTTNHASDEKKSAIRSIPVAQRLRGGDPGEAEPSLARGAERDPGDGDHAVLVQQPFRGGERVRGEGGGRRTKQ